MIKSEYLNNKVFEKTIKNFLHLKRQKLKYELILDNLKESKYNREKRSNKKHNVDEKIEQKTKEYELIKIDFSQIEYDLSMSFYLLSEKVVKWLNYDIDAEEAKQEGACICLEKIDRYDPQKGGPFQYFTSVIWNANKQAHRSKKNYNNLKSKYKEHLMHSEKTIIKNNKEMPNFSNFD